MKKIISIILCIILLSCSLIINASAAVKELPDGGQMENSGYQEVYGKSSGGTDGKANIRCKIVFNSANAGGKDSATATTYSDVSSGLWAYTNTAVWYSDTSGGKYVTANKEVTTIPLAGFSVTSIAPNNFGYEATAGHVIDFNTRGDWICGTYVKP